MDLAFWKMCPSGNTTILISEPYVAPHMRASMANALMHPLHLQAEQVAFVDMEAARIDMMGGEFCGNACRSFAAMLAMHHGVEELEGVMLSSGTEKAVAYKVCKSENGMMNAAIRMPNTSMPAVTYVKMHTVFAPIVHLEGIDHLLLNEDEHPRGGGFQNAAQTEDTVRAILAEHGLLESVAAGCIWYKYDEATGQCTITPFVYVRETQSLFAETACGSGTLAVALYLAGMTQEHGKYHEHSAHNQCITDFSLHVMQPSGMHIVATCSQYIEDHQNTAHIEAWIGGDVTCIAKGTTWLTL